MEELREAIHRIYGRYDAPLHPFMGDAYVAPRPGDFRILVVGVNLLSHDEGPSVVFQDEPTVAMDGPVPATDGEFAAAFVSGYDEFSRHAHRMGVALGQALLADSTLYQGLALRGPNGLGSFYVTNALKRRPEAEATVPHDQSAERLFRHHLLQWYGELDVLAERRLLPHLLLVVGDDFWSWACRTFRMDRARPLPHVVTTGYRWSPGPALNHVQRYDFASQAAPMLLVKCAPPGQRSGKGRSRWLLSQPDFRELAGLPAEPPGASD